MYKILKKKKLAPDIILMEVETPRMASSAQPGQFLIVKVNEKGERIPLTICDFDREKGSVTIVTQVVGASSRMICRLNEGDSFLDFVGPLGQPAEFIHEPIEELRKRRYLFIAGGVGAAPVYPQAKWLHSRGVHVDVIMGARSKDMIILREEMSAVCDNLYICTDDGSDGFNGLVTGKLRELMEGGERYDQAVAIGPMIMMKFVTLTAKEFDLPLIVSLNTLMVDGTGMCGACRLSIGGVTKFACVDGPEFDAYLVNFDEAMRRQAMYKSMEVEADHKCKIGLGE